MENKDQGIQLNGKGAREGFVLEEITDTYITYGPNGEWINKPLGYTRKGGLVIHSQGIFDDQQGNNNYANRYYNITLEACPKGTDKRRWYTDSALNMISLNFYDYNKDGLTYEEAKRQGKLAEIEAIKRKNNVTVDCDFFAENIGIDNGEADTYRIGSGKSFYNALYSKWIVGSGTNLFLTPGDSTKYGNIRITNEGYLYPDHSGSVSGGTYSLGMQNYPFYNLYTKYGVIQTSDKRDKDNIKYLAENNLNEKDCAKFVKDELKLATYNMKSDTDAKTQLGFIAQDIMDTKLGSLIVEKGETESDKLAYSLSNYVNVLAGALQNALKEIDDLKAKIK